MTACYPYRAETGPYFVPGLPHVVAHPRRVWKAGATPARQACGSAAGGALVLHTRGVLEPATRP